MHAGVGIAVNNLTQRLFDFQPLLATIEGNPKSWGHT